MTQTNETQGTQTYARQEWEAYVEQFKQDYPEPEIEPISFDDYLKATDSARLNVPDIMGFEIVGTIPSNMGPDWIMLKGPRGADRALVPYNNDPNTYYVINEYGVPTHLKCNYSMQWTGKHWQTGR